MIPMATKLMAAVSVLLLPIGTVDAQDKFPKKPIRVVVGFIAGSGTDFLARTIGQKMSENWGQQVVVDNRAGAGGVIASEIVARATPDGYTLLMAAVGHAVNASLFRKLPYDSINDFAGISYVADVPNVLVIAPSVTAKSVRELIDLAKSKPGQLNYGSGGLGSSTHINGELFNMAAGIKVVHVPYKGAPEMITNTIAGNIDYAFVPVSAGAPLIRAGKVTALAVSTRNRSPVLPAVPSLDEAGLAGFDFSGWYGILAPAKTPSAVREQLANEVARILALQDVRDRLLTQGATPHATSPAEFDAFIKSEVARFANVIRAAGIRVD